MSLSILVLSGNSKVGAEAVRQLLDRNLTVRVGARDMSKASPLAQPGAEVVHADLARPETLHDALAGVERVLLTSAPDREVAALHGKLYTAATTTGVRHVVRVSAIGASPRAKAALVRAHGQAEAALESSGLAWTHVRPHSFMQNFLGSARSIVREGKIYSAMGEGRVPHVDVRDIASVAVACLTTDGHEGKSYTVTGPKALTMSEVAAQLGEALERSVEYVDLPPDVFVSGAVAAGMPDWLAQDLAALYSNVFARNHAAAVSPAVRELTGREAIAFSRFARDHAHVFRAAAA